MAGERPGGAGGLCPREGAGGSEGRPEAEGRARLVAEQQGKGATWKGGAATWHATLLRGRIRPRSCITVKSRPDDTRMSLLAAWIAAAAFLGPAARPLRGAHQQPRDAPAVRGSVVLLAADATERSDFVRQQHSWESAPNPQFDYDEDSKWLTEGIEAVRSQNTDVLLPLLSQIRSRPFFRVFAVDLLASCSYTPTHEEPCMLDACEIEPTDEVPSRIVERDEDEYEFELDSWARWDMPSDYTEYYDLEKVH